MRTMRLSIAVALAICGAAFAEAPDNSAAALKSQMQQDVVLRALVDELERGRTGLLLQDMDRPYFIEYTLDDDVRAAASAVLGAITSKGVYRSRDFTSDVRVGSYELDHTNFGRGGGFSFGGMFSFGGGAPMPIEDDYLAIRQSIWWTTDRDYKGVLEQLEQKKAFMKSKVIEDKPADFSREEPTVHFDDPARLDIDAEPLAKLAAQLAGVFREFPEIKESSVSVSANGGNRYLVNTEGTRMRTGGLVYSVLVNASVQADDGMDLSNSFFEHARALADLPSADELAERARAMARQLIAVKNAPLLDSYTGPILVDAEAAATIFTLQFATRFAGGQRPVGSTASPDDFANKLGKRILPRFMTVVDDPSVENLDGVMAFGHYEYDEQGVRAQRVQLVEEGRLKALLMSRNPSKEYSKSNGHGRGYGRAGVGCLVVSAQEPASAAELKTELIEAAQDEDLEYGIRIEALGGVGSSSRSYGGGTMPLVMYKVYPDGREELVRGANISRIDLRAFKRIMAAGDKPYVYNSVGGAGSTVAVPALLFEELDLAKMDRDFDKPPILPSPLARAESN